MRRSDLLRYVRETDPGRLAGLWKCADQAARRTVGSPVHLRGLIEIGNHCVGTCLYCGLRAPRRGVTRYRMQTREIVAAAHEAARCGFGSVVLQAGESPSIEPQWLANVIERITSETKLAVTLSLGERDSAALALWRERGASRYLLRFETSDAELYRALHPGTQRTLRTRLDKLEELRALGYEIGTGMLIGLPGQTVDTLVEDLLLLRSLDPDMIGIGPWVPHPDTPLGARPTARTSALEDQVPRTYPMVWTALALTRLLCPEANIPRTTALDSITPVDAREQGLRCGTNVIMPNMTPAKYRLQYDIYPGKSNGYKSIRGLKETIAQELQAVERPPGQGAGNRLRRVQASEHFATGRHAPAG